MSADERPPVTAPAAGPVAARGRRRWRLAGQLALLQVGGIALALLAMAGVVAWNLRSGFDELLRAQDQQRLAQFVTRAERLLAQQGLEALPTAGTPLASALGFLEAAADLPHDGHPHPHPPGWGPDGATPPGDAASAPGGLMRRPPPDPNAFVPRLSLLDPQGQLQFGRPARPGERVMREPLRLQGRVVGLVELHARPLPPLGIEGQFLARQFMGVALVAAVLMLIALGVSLALARRWVRPVQEARDAARRISAGAFDVRLQRRSDNEFGDLAEDINRMAQALQALDTSRRRWIAELSHELRTPLAVLRAELESLHDGIRPLDRAALDSLASEVQRLSRLTDDFHQLALSDLRALPVDPAPVDATDLIDGLQARIAPRAAAAGLPLVPADLTPLRARPEARRAHWDAQRIEQLLQALLENSLRYTDAPGTLRLRVEADARGLGLVVEDSAPGVPADLQPRLFDPLFRADPSRSRRSGGSGLGLAIARAIARAHGGTLDAADSPLGGLALRLSLPWDGRTPEASA